MKNLFNRPRTAFPSALLLVLCLAGTGGCAANPVTGERELVLISTGSEIAMGEENYPLAQQAEGGRYTVDAELTEYVASVGRRVAAVSDRALPYEFVVLNNSAPNAWALPGGKIAVNRGLLLELDNEAELAAVLGHEVVHAAARHGARARQRGLFFGAIQLGVALAGKDSEYADYAVGGAALALGLANQKYSRDAERTSDYHGMKYMHAAGYDTATAVTLQEKFGALSAGEGRKNSWLDGLFASHPPSAERVARNREALAQFPAGGEIGRARYQRQLARLRARRDAYAQADRARQLIDTDPEAALQTIDAAIRQEAREPLFHGIKGHILAHQNRHRDAVREYGAAIERTPHPGYYEHFLGRGLAYNHLGQRAQARSDLARSNQLFPTAVAAYHLGGIALADGERAYAKQLFEAAGKAEGGIGGAAREAFVALDIADAPERYADVEILFEDGEVRLAVKNLTTYGLRNIVAGVEVTLTGETIPRRPARARLAAGAAATLSSGVRYREEDEVKVKAGVLQAEVAR